MCQATVYIVKDGEERVIMRDVIRLEQVEGGLQLQTFFEDPVTVEGRVERIDFLKHTVTVVPLKEA